MKFMTDSSAYLALQDMYLVSNTPIINLFFQQTLDAPSDQSNNSSLTRYDQDHHRIRKRREKSTIILVSIVLIFLLCHMFRFSLKVCIFLPDTGSPPLTRLGPEKNRVKGKPCYRRSILVHTKTLSSMIIYKVNIH